MKITHNYLNFFKFIHQKLCVCPLRITFSIIKIRIAIFKETIGFQKHNSNQNVDQLNFAAAAVLMYMKQHLFCLMYKGREYNVCIKKNLTLTSLDYWSVLDQSFYFAYNFLNSTKDRPNIMQYSSILQKEVTSKKTCIIQYHT